MATERNWADCPVLESFPGKVSGAWVFKGTRVPVWAVMSGLKDLPASRISEDYPSITTADVEQLLDYIAASAWGQRDDAIAA